MFAHCGTCGKGDSHKAAPATCEKGEDGKCVGCKKDKDGKCAECKKDKDDKCAKCKKDKDDKCAECKEGKRDCGDKVKKQSDQPKKAAPAKAPQGQQTTGATGQGNKK